jgi:type IV fimbrial biogenesis protein FimT
MKKQSGFTLIELMVTIAIAVILITSAVPGFQSFIQNNRLSTTTHQLVTSLNLARSEAVKRGKQVTVCKSDNSSTCTNANGWDQGWIVFVDEDGDGQRQTSGTPEELLRVQNALAGSITISGQDDVEHLISYTETGFPELIAGGTLRKEFSTLVVCVSNNFDAHSRAVILNATGSIRSTSATDPSVNAGVTGCSV